MAEIETLQLLSPVNQDLAEAAWKKMRATGWANPSFKLGDSRLDVADLPLDEEEEADRVRVMVITLRDKDDDEYSKKNQTVYLKHRPGELWKIEEGTNEEMDEATANLILEALMDSEALSEADELEETARRFADAVRTRGFVDEGEA